MNLLDREALLADLKRDEGVYLKPYRDSVGKLTIGIGRNLDDRGISQNTCDQMANEDIAICAAELDKNIPWWRELSPNRQRALANMIFNLGWPRLSGFNEMLDALEMGNFNKASQEALNSQWANQVGIRAIRIAHLFEEG